MSQEQQDDDDGGAADDSESVKSIEETEKVDIDSETESETGGEAGVSQGDQEARGGEETDEGENSDGREHESDDDVPADEDADLLIPVDDYLSAGVHIGTQQKTGHMERFIHHVREDGLYVLDIERTDERIRTAANFLEDYEPSKILISSSRRYGQHPAEVFAEATGARVSAGRFIPGTLTNPEYDGYIEPEILIVTDPIGDAQAVKEAVTVGIPVIAMCDTNNATNNVDLVVPTNNKGRKALSVVYWLLANELLESRGVETDYSLDDFEPEV